MCNRIIVLFILLFIPFGAQALKPSVHGSALVYTTKGNFTDVKNDVVDAILENGMVISYVAHVKSMLDRTAKAAGVKASVYDNGETILTCKSGLSHDLAKANPHHIVLCPWGISVYTLKGKPNTVYVSIRQPYKDEKSYMAVHKMLQEIIKDALD